VRVSVAELRASIESSVAGLGLALESHPEWCDVSFGSSYTVTYFLAGPRILFLRTTGFATTADIEGIAGFEQRLRAERMTDAPYVRIEDWSRMPGASRGARDRYLQHVLDDPRLLAIVFVKLPAVYRLAVAMSMRARRLRFTVLFADRYDRAFRLADSLIGEPSTGRTVPSTTGVDLSLVHSGFSIRFRVVGGQFLLAEAAGRFTSDHLGPSLDLQERVFVESGLAPNCYQFVLGLEHVTGLDPRTRRPYVEALRRFHERHPMAGMTIHGLGGIIRMAVNLYRPFMPFPVKIVESREAALAEGVAGAASMRRSRARSRRRWVGLPAYRRQLLEYLEGLGWELDGGGDAGSWPARHPLAPVFEAIRLLKWEFDDLLATQAKIQNELRIAKESAERANRAKSDFLASVSHELRTPLGHILGFTDLVLRGPLDSMSGEQREMLGDIRRAGHRLRSMIDGLLDLARIDPDHPEPSPVPVGLRSVLAESLALVAEAAAAKDVALELDDENAPALVMADPQKLQRALRCLLSNAIECTPAGGSVVLGARRAEAAAAGVVQLSVADTWSGPGLSLCRSLVELSGGTMLAEGPGRQAAFRFSLPAGVKE
jgi:signal transduction histidine kinase